MYQPRMDIQASSCLRASSDLSQEPHAGATNRSQVHLGAKEQFDSVRQRLKAPGFEVVALQGLPPRETCLLPAPLRQPGVHLAACTYKRHQHASWPEPRVTLQNAHSDAHWLATRPQPGLLPCKLQDIHATDMHFGLSYTVFVRHPDIRPLPGNLCYRDASEKHVGLPAGFEQPSGPACPRLVDSVSS